MCRALVRLDSVVCVQVDQTGTVDQVDGARTLAGTTPAADGTDEDEELVAKFGTKVQRVVRELNGRLGCIARLRLVRLGVDCSGCFKLKIVRESTRILELMSFQPCVCASPRPSHWCFLTGSRCST